MVVFVGDISLHSVDPWVEERSQGVNTGHMGVKEGAMGPRSGTVRVWWPFFFSIREPLAES
jgi:hypothetical protein